MTVFTGNLPSFEGISLPSPSTNERPESTVSEDWGAFSDAAPAVVTADTAVATATTDDDWGAFDDEGT